ncbi:MAG: hypothetical protein ACK58T_39940 [Phycisphaerae bacterium]
MFHETHLIEPNTIVCGVGQIMNETDRRKKKRPDSPHDSQSNQDLATQETPSFLHREIHHGGLPKIQISGHQNHHQDRYLDQGTDRPRHQPTRDFPDPGERTHSAVNQHYHRDCRAPPFSGQSTDCLKRNPDVREYNSDDSRVLEHLRNPTRQTHRCKSAETERQRFAQRR